MTNVLQCSLLCSQYWVVIQHSFLTDGWEGVMCNNSNTCHLGDYDSVFLYFSLLHVLQYRYQGVMKI